MQKRSHTKMSSENKTLLVNDYNTDASNRVIPGNDTDDNLLDFIYNDTLFQNEINYIRPVRKYTYLLSNTHHRGEDTLLDNETPFPGSLIVRDESNENSNKYMMFQSPKEYRDVYHRYTDKTFTQVESHLTHEVVLAELARKLFFDIDGGSRKDHDTIIAEIELCFYDNYGLEPEIMRIESVNTKPGETKMSTHVVITNYAAANVCEMQWFYRKLRQGLPDELSALLDRMDTPNHNFRMPLTTNEKGRRLELPLDQFETALVTNVVGLPILPRYAEHTIGDSFTFNEANIKDLPEEVNKYILSLSNTFHEPTQSGNILKFKRKISSECIICKRSHESSGMYICLFYDDSKALNCAYHYCYRSPGAKHLIWKNPDGKCDIIDNTPVFTLDALLTKYHNKRFTKMVNSQIISDMKNVFFVKASAASSLILVRVDTYEYDLQRLNAFIAAIKIHFIWISKKRMTFGEIIETYINDFRCRGFVFRPNNTIDTRMINLFNGFAAIGLDENINMCQPILDHLLKVWANNDQKVYDYILDWLAAVIQGNKTGTVLVLYSEKQGAGKNRITDHLIRKVIGQAYACETNDIEQIAAKFNGRFSNKILTVINEAHNIEGNYHKLFDKLKDLITSKTITIEKKGIDSIEVDDFQNFIITTNNKYPVKVEQTDRRYSFIKINETYARDKEYFINLSKYVDGEYSDKCASGLLYLLLNRKITNNYREPLHTNWKDEILDMHKPIDPILSFIESIQYEVNEISEDVIYNDYVQHCNKQLIRPGPKDQFIKKLIVIGFIINLKRTSRRENGQKINYNKVVIAAVYIANPDG